MFILVMGVSGCGKSTIGKMLSKKIGLKFIDADDHHSRENKIKMMNGISLNDQDRWPWIHELITKSSLEISSSKGVVLACSALKVSYRKQFEEHFDGMITIWLDGEVGLIAERLFQRKSHFMSKDLLKSQIESLQPPENALRIDIKNTEKYIIELICNHIRGSGI